MLDNTTRNIMIWGLWLMPTFRIFEHGIDGVTLFGYTISALFTYITWKHENETK